MKIRFGLVFIFLLVAVLVSCKKEKKGSLVPEPPSIPFEGKWPEIEEEKAEIGTKENPQARRAYQRAMLVDPQTGQLPPDIRQKEMDYSAKLPSVGFSGGYLRKAGTDDWNTIGPYNVGGRTRALAIDQSNERVVLAGGVSGGMWRSEDEAGTWTKTTVPGSIHSVTCLAQDTRPGMTNIWYYGTGEFTSNSASKKAAPYRGDGVFKSTDGGKTWSQLLSTAEGEPNRYNSQYQYIWKILPNRFQLQHDEVFLATVGAILRSTDGGLTWSVVLGRKRVSNEATDLNDANLSDYTDIVQTTDGVFYASFSSSSRSGSSPDQGIYRSTDGINWTNIAPLAWPRNYNRTVIATSSTRPNELFFSVNAQQEMLWKYNYIAGDGTRQGGRWTNLSDNLPRYGGEVGDYNTQSSYNMVLMVHPSLADVIFLGGTNLYRSTDAFASTKATDWVGGYDTANNIRVFANHFVDQHALAFFPSNPNKMLSSNDGGVFATNNNMTKGIAWEPRNYGFVTTQFYTLGLDEFGAKGAVMGGLQDNGTLIAKNPGVKSSWNALI
ncbi:MAG: hypothetical protein HC819_20875 [Cyclobacteriaceae bacterium]|nr:hypothetical protein [Cyclobacteriaceae bacterium]